jgi:hypothetical protein
VGPLLQVWDVVQEVIRRCAAGAPLRTLWDDAAEANSEVLNNAANLKGWQDLSSQPTGTPSPMSQ